MEGVNVHIARRDTADTGTQDDLHHFPRTVRVDPEGANRAVDIVGDGEALATGEEEKRQHVALGEGRDEEVLGVPAVHFAVKGGSGRSQQIGLVGVAHCVSTEADVAVTRGADCPTLPGDLKLKLVAVHRSTSLRVSCEPDRENPREGG